MKYEILKYFDIFGTKFHFYTDERPRLYTIFGGISSVILVFVCFILFIFYNLDDLKRNSSTVTTSNIPLETYHIIKLNEEKIWLPFRIVDYYNKIKKNSTLVYPIIYYYEKIRNETNSNFETNIKLLKYKLCNETSMIHRSEIYKINVPLNQLFCIETDNSEIGGSLISTFLKYIKINFYYNPNFSKNITENNYLKIEFYFPVIHFQQINKNNPITVLYKRHFYNINKYSNKIERLYLKEYKLNDDLGWIIKDDKNYSFWGLSEIKSDFYINKDLISEKNNPVIYSLSIFLESGFILYKRKYKKIIQIIFEGLPVIYVVFIIFQKFVKLVKLTEENTKLIELLFENLHKKKDKLIDLKKKIFADKNKNSNLNIPAEDNSNLKISQYSSNFLNQENQKKARKSVQITPINQRIENNNNNILSNNISLFEIQKGKITVSPKKVGFRKSAIDGSINDFFENSIRYETLKLFPSKYYFYANFIRNFDIDKLNCCFSQKFSKVYSFYSKIIDIVSYLKLIKEFELMKKKLLKTEDINMIENARKINVNERMFIRNMNECIDNGNFLIFSQNVQKKFK